MNGIKGVIISNIITIIAAIIFKWDVYIVMAGFWCQSIIIGLFNELRINALEQFSTEGFKINNREVSPTPEVKRQVLIFFPVHYGFFHFIYMIFIANSLSSRGNLNGSLLFELMIISIPFFISHLKDFEEKVELDRQHVVNIGKLLFFPYARIIPMHLAIIFGAFAKGKILLLFLVLKTGADVIMHIVETNFYNPVEKSNKYN